MTINLAGLVKLKMRLPYDIGILLLRWDLPQRNPDMGVQVESSGIVFVAVCSGEKLHRLGPGGRIVT